MPLSAESTRRERGVSHHTGPKAAVRRTLRSGAAYPPETPVLSYSDRAAISSPTNAGLPRTGTAEAGPETHPGPPVAAIFHPCDERPSRNAAAAAGPQTCPGRRPPPLLRSARRRHEPGTAEKPSARTDSLRLTGRRTRPTAPHGCGRHGPALHPSAASLRAVPPRSRR